MNKKLATVLLGTVMLAATPATAATVMYNLTISGSGSSSTPSNDTPYFLLSNTSTHTGAPNSADALTAMLTSFKLTFNGTSYVDRLTSFQGSPNATSPGISNQVIYPTPNTQDNIGTPGFQLGLTGFNPGDGYRFAVDFDKAGGANENYRSLLEGAVIEVGFSDGTKLTKTLSGFNANDPSFSFSGSDISAAVPEPATWGLMILGIGGIGASLRRRKATLATA